MRTELYAGVLHDQFTVLYPLFLFAWLREASDIAGSGCWQPHALIQNYRPTDVCRLQGYLAPKKLPLPRTNIGP